MKTRQTYYCAWHPEHDFVAETTAQTESMSWEFLVTPDLPRKSVDIKQRIDDQIKRHKSYGWQVKEVVIVEKYSEGKYGCIDDYLKECFSELYKLKEMNEYGGMGNVNHDVLYRHRINS